MTEPLVGVKIIEIAESAARVSCTLSSRRVAGSKSFRPLPANREIIALGLSTPRAARS